MAPAVVGVALALDEPMLFELVEQADERAAVVAECVRDRGLRLRHALVEQREDRVVVRVEALLLVDLERAALGGEAKPLEQEDVRRHQLGGKPRGRLCIDLCVNAHLVEYGSATKRSSRV